MKRVFAVLLSALAIAVACIAIVWGIRTAKSRGFLGFGNAGGNGAASSVEDDLQALSHADPQEFKADWNQLAAGVPQLSTSVADGINVSRKGSWRELAWACVNSNDGRTLDARSTSLEQSLDEDTKDPSGILRLRTIADAVDTNVAQLKELNKGTQAFYFTEFNHPEKLPILTAFSDLAQDMGSSGSAGAKPVIPIISLREMAVLRSLKRWFAGSFIEAYGINATTDGGKYKNLLENMKSINSGHRLLLQGATIEGLRDEINNEKAMLLTQFHDDAHVKIISDECAVMKKIVELFSDPENSPSPRSDITGASLAAPVGASVTPSPLVTDESVKHFAVVSVDRRSNVSPMPVPVPGRSTSGGALEV